MLLSLEEFERLASIVRTDIVEPENEDERLYKVPDWLKNEFSSQELMMFRNQFMIIDVDKGGSIDAEELQVELAFCARPFLSSCVPHTNTHAHTHTHTHTHTHPFL